jgi:hypothetical protein
VLTPNLQVAQRGTTAQAAAKVEITITAPKGAIEKERHAPSLKPMP